MCSVDLIVGGDWDPEYPTMLASRILVQIISYTFPFGTAGTATDPGGSFRDYASSNSHFSSTATGMAAGPSNTFATRGDPATSNSTATPSSSASNPLTGMNGGPTVFRDLNKLKQANRLNVAQKANSDRINAQPGVKKLAATSSLPMKEFDFFLLPETALVWDAGQARFQASKHTTLELAGYNRRVQLSASHTAAQLNQRILAAFEHFPEVAVYGYQICHFAKVKPGSSDRIVPLEKEFGWRAILLATVDTAVRRASAQWSNIVYIVLQSGAPDLVVPGTQQAPISVDSDAGSSKLSQKRSKRKASAIEGTDSESDEQPPRQKYRTQPGPKASADTDSSDDGGAPPASRRSARAAPKRTAPVPLTDSTDEDVPPSRPSAKPAPAAKKRRAPEPSSSSSDEATPKPKKSKPASKPAARPDSDSDSLPDAEELRARAQGKKKATDTPFEQGLYDDDFAATASTDDDASVKPGTRRGREASSRNGRSFKAPKPAPTSKALPLYPPVHLRLTRGLVNMGAVSPADRDLRLEVLAAIRNPYNSPPYSPGAEDDLFDTVPAQTSHHNNLSPHSPGSPTLAWLFNNPPPEFTPIMPNANPTPMPARGAHTAPKFDSSKPEELRRYFNDVEYLLEQANITDEAQMKKACVRYMSVQDQELLEGLIEFTDANKTYDEFKSAARAMYAGNDDDHLYTLKDWDAHLGSISRQGIRSEKDLATFYRDFIRIGRYLITKNRLSETEQSHAFLRALQPASLQIAVKQRLQILKPNIHADDPYALSDLYDAAKFALAGTTFYPLSPPAPEPAVKTESSDIAALLKAVTQLVQVMSTQAKPGASSDNRDNRSNGNQQRSQVPGCAYCEDLSHFFRDCPIVTEDKKKGVCKLGSRGRLVTPIGTTPPMIDGAGLRKRFMKWHEENPGHLVTPQLILGLAATPGTTSTFILTDEQRAETLVTELNAVRTRMAARKATEAQADPKVAKPTTPPAADPAPVPVSDTTIPVQPSVPFPPHPYAAARDAAYAPPADRNVGAVPKPNNRPPAPVSKDGDERKVFNASLDAQITISNRDLLSVAPGIRTLYRDAVTPRRSPANQPATQLLNAVDDPFGSLEDYATDDSTKNDDRETAIFNSLPAAYTTAAHSIPSPPTDGIVASDPFEVYYNEGRIPEGLVVSAEAKAIRSILLVVDNQQAIESIVDPGSQICAMSEAICHELALVYDPTIILQMQSANGAITPSLGLARNVPFRIGDIILYLQVHIVRNPAYDILLGRPFDVLTHSVVRNYGNDDQTITIVDPNTGKTATVPTIPRGSSRGNTPDFLIAKRSLSKR
ncbi:hypothetical protein C8F01DRAFT_1276170 [Mycena amicta]|nr:hypothetical protein C8F01DRAFT_1276170 [Mycena amicta]